VALIHIQVAVVDQKDVLPEEDVDAEAPVVAAGGVDLSGGLLEFGVPGACGQKGELVQTRLE